MKNGTRQLLLALLVISCGDGMSGGTGGGSGGNGGGQGGGGGGGVRPHLSGLPDCGTVSDAGTLADFYDRIIGFYGCAAGGCHGPGPGAQLFQFGDAPSLRAVWVDAGSGQASMKRITPGDIDQSYVLYKLWGQHLDAGVSGGFGDRMPQGGPFLHDDEMCTIINWVKSGAR
jgi:hypothetical protein